MLKRWKKGISLRMIHIWQIIVTLIMACTVIFSTIRLTSTFKALTSATEEHMELEKAALKLIEASDYLTENVQRFTINGDMRFLNNYFTEAFESNRREEALSKMKIDERTEPAFKRLQEAMNSSVHLMDREYYAMRLVIDAKGYTDYPDVLKNVELSSEDAALSAGDKMILANHMVLDDEYYRQKEDIRQNMSDSLSEVDRLMYSIEEEVLSSLRQSITIVRLVILIQVVLILFLVALTTYLGINPILKAVDKIKNDNTIPEVGANEFKYLAQAYNKMYSQTKNSLEALQFKAYHDELTGAYNRAGYELLLSSIDLKTTYIMLLDIDNFKSINDTHGHEAGDKVLIKLVDTLKGVFRDDDFICRIGGDEFVIFMVHSSQMNKRLIVSKIRQINEELENPDNRIPPFSISVGIVNGRDIDDTGNIFEKVDEAMYESKKQGKNTYTFYTQK